MKRLLTILFAFQIHIAFGQTFDVTINVIFLDIKESIKPVEKVILTHSVKFRNEFICFFQVDGSDTSKLDKKYCFIFSDTSKKPKVVEVPDEVEYTVFFDLFVNNDQVYLKTYMNSRTFYFDPQKSKWIRTDNAKDLIFEDENYYVYSRNFGEWGGKTWFKDKKTKAEYLIEITTPLINKIGTVYYLTRPFSIVKVENPLNLNKCHRSVTYEKIEKGVKFASWYGKPTGFEIIYNDTTAKNHFYDFSYRPHIVASFVWQKELFHVFETDTTTYIAKHDGDSIKPIQDIGSHLQFFENYYTYRNRIQKDGYQLLNFKYGSKFGLMEISGRKISLFYLNWKDE